MKLSLFAILFPLLLLGSLVSAAATIPDVIRARQAHVKRDFIDVCVALDEDIRLVGVLLGRLDICLCISAVPSFLSGNHPVAKTAVSKFGQDNACGYFDNLIRNHRNNQQCHYPSNAIPVCDVSCPCNFKCDKGYTPFPNPHPTECVCKAPYKECNGVCGYFPNGCGPRPSRVPRVALPEPSVF